MKDSPLAEVVRDRRFNAILGSIRRAVQLGEPLTIEPKAVDYFRRTFRRGILLGERRLYQLAHRLLNDLARASTVKTTFVVWGRCLKPAHTELQKAFMPIPDPDRWLYGRPDSEVSNESAPLCPRCGLKTTGILSFVQYKPDPLPSSGLWLLSTRIKTTSNLCYKVADLVFDIDRMFRHDKIHGQFSQIVTDVYGVKLIVRAEAQVWELLKRLRKFRGLKILEEKDYIGPRRKKSGFEVYKAIAKSQQQLFEIQIQSRAMFEAEESGLPAAHRTYKEKQMADRRKLGKEYSDLYRALTQLLSPPDQNVSQLEYVELGHTQKGLDDEF